MGFTDKIALAAKKKKKKWAARCTKLLPIQGFRERGIARSLILLCKRLVS